MYRLTVRSRPQRAPRSRRGIDSPSKQGPFTVAEECYNPAGPMNSGRKGFGRHRISQCLLVLMALFFVLAKFYFFHDIYTLILFIAGIGFVLVGSGWSRWVIATLLICSGLYWSRLEREGCSLTWRISALISHATGFLPQLGWREVAKIAMTREHCFSPEGKDRWVADSIELLEQQAWEGHDLGQYGTPMGRFWIPSGESRTWEWLLWEILVYRTYDSGESVVSAGDTVIDCGAHIGVFTRYALNKGARRVVAIEPNPVNIACLKRNFAAEIENGRVTVVEVGLGKETSSLELAVHEHDTARSVITPHDLPGTHKITVPIAPLDNVVENLALERIDFIKMDIEGSERWGLKGGQRTIKRFHPQLAISSYGSSGFLVGE